MFEDLIGTGFAALILLVGLAFVFAMVWSVVAG